MKRINHIGQRALIAMAALTMISAAVSLAGCGVAARVDARNDYQTSAANYKACLVANPAAPQNCEGLRLAMETDERKYNNFSAGLDPGSQRSANITVLSR
jgi:hypothetical protein